MDTKHIKIQLLKNLHWLLAIFPFMLLISVVLALIVKSEIQNQGGPVTINVTPESNQST